MGRKAGKFASIIMVNHSSNKARSGFLKKSLVSLLSNTVYPFEFILIDNGGVINDSEYLLSLTQAGKINTYIRNNRNMHFGYARNQGIQIANGDFLAIVDNDILYEKGWLEQCVSILEAYPNEKIYSTPLYNVAHWAPKYWDKKTLKIGKVEWRLNRRAGSNCFVIRRNDLEKIGRFQCHRVGGTKWTEKAYAKGYWAAVTPRLMVLDMGFRKGYSINKTIPVKEVLSDGSEVYFTDDEYKKEHPENFYKKQGKFNVNED